MSKIIGALLLICCSIIAQAQSKEIKGRALLVGINHYADPDVPATPGCVEDANSLAAFIQTKYGFARGSIKVLLNEQATAANIQKQFKEWLIDGTQPGDRVFFSYAGHGSQLPDDNGDEADKLDETIAPFDIVRRTGANQIRDDAFEKLTQQLSGRLVVMLFDSCHSGTISRGVPKLGSLPNGGGVRYLPRADQWQELQKSGGREVGPGYVVTNNANATEQRLLIDSNQTGRLAGVVVLSAANSKQTANPAIINGTYRGALSYTFVEAQRRDTPALQDLLARIRSQVATMQQSGLLDGSQQPQLEVISTIPLSDKPLFALQETTQATAILTALANPRSNVKLRLSTHQPKAFYRVGETISYDVTSDTAGYLYLLVFSPNNVASCLIPNSIDRDNFIVAGTVTFPRGAYEIPIQEPIGKDVVVALLSKEKLNLGEKLDYTWAEIFTRLNFKRFSEFVKTRDLSLEIPPASITDWQATAIVVESVK